jgi:hypothetical protein
MLDLSYFLHISVRLVALGPGYGRAFAGRDS